MMPEADYFRKKALAETTPELFGEIESPTERLLQSYLRGERSLSEDLVLKGMKFAKKRAECLIKFLEEKNGGISDAEMRFLKNIRLFWPTVRRLAFERGDVNLSFQDGWLEILNEAKKLSKKILSRIEKLFVTDVEITVKN